MVTRNCESQSRISQFSEKMETAFRSETCNMKELGPGCLEERRFLKTIFGSPQLQNFKNIYGRSRGNFKSQGFVEKRDGIDEGGVSN